MKINKDDGVERDDVVKNRVPFVLKDFIRHYFGTHWAFLLAFIFLIVFGPAFFLSSKIKFDPAIFVNEWLKIGISGILIYVILQIAAKRHDMIHTAETINDLLSLMYSKRLIDLAILVKDAPQKVSKNKKEIPSIANSLNQKWKELRNSLDPEALNFISDQHLKLYLKSHLTDITLNYCDSAFSTINNTLKSEQAKNECDNLARHLEIIAYAFSNALYKL